MSMPFDLLEPDSMNTNKDWKLVPVIATDDMEAAAEDDYEQTGATFPRWKSAYAAMIAAAPPAPTSHPIPTGATGEDAEQVRHKMNADLCAFYMRWEADGDYLRCRKCKRPQIASYAEKGFPHAAGCKAVGNVEQRPWIALVELMRPLIGSVAPAAGGALEVLTDDEILHRWDTHVGDSPITESDKLCFAREIESDLLSKLSKRDAKDAARYRWWCDTGNDIASADTIGGKPTIDAAIDAAIAQQSQQAKGGEA